MSFSVLVIDDEPLARTYLALNIPKLCPEFDAIATAKNGLEGLDLFSKQKFDLVITDIRMPEMNGLQLCSEIKRRNNSQRVAILSGYDEFSYAQEAIQYGVCDYLLKPIELSQLGAMLHKIWQLLLEEQAAFHHDQYLTEIAGQYRVSIISEYLGALSDHNVSQQFCIEPMLKQLNVSLFEHSAVVAVLSAQDVQTRQQEAVNLFLYLSAKEVAQMADETYLFYSEGQMLALLLTGVSNELPDKTDKLVKYLQEFLAAHMRADVFCGISDIFMGKDGLRAHVRQARERLERAMPAVTLPSVILKNNASNRQVTAAKNYILQNYQNPISLISIAEYIGVSPNYLSSLFKNVEGETYIKYITRIRMDAAEHLLKSYPTKKVTEIAEECGFFNVKHFFQVFRRVHGMTPGEYCANERG